MVGSKAHARSNITSVELGRKDPSSCGNAILILVGIAKAAAGFVGPNEKARASGLVWLALGATAILGGYMSSKRAKPASTVKVGSASGDSTYLGRNQRADCQTRLRRRHDVNPEAAPLAHD